VGATNYRAITHLDRTSPEIAPFGVVTQKETW
jgi:hypothetical protein